MMDSLTTPAIHPTSASPPSMGELSLSITKQKRGYRLESAIELPRPRDEVFEFFADARNLELLTPPFLRFQVLTPDPIEMKEGAIIDYRIKVRFLPMRWRTEITAWDPPYRFKDFQVRGPYLKWDHEHRFTETARGTLCEDQVDYSVPGGALIHALVVRRDVEQIFRYRASELMRRFGHPT